MAQLRDRHQPGMGVPAELLEDVPVWPPSVECDWYGAYLALGRHIEAVREWAAEMGLDLRRAFGLVDEALNDSCGEPVSAGCPYPTRR